MQQARGLRLPALDGLRAISIFLVVLAHSAGTRHMPLPTNAFTSCLAGFGVRIFFVISGFLITTLLFAESDRSGTISLPSFYVRRAWRIFPAFYAYLAAIVVLAALGAIQLNDGDVLASLTYTVNYHRPRAWYLGHLWSLSVEEQFYLLWPAIVFLTKKRQAMAIAALAVAAAPVIRVAVFVLAPDHRLGIGESFPTVFDALAAGCLLGGLRHELAAHRVYEAFMRSPLFGLVPLAALFFVFVEKVSIDLAIGTTVQNLGIALTIDWCVRRHDTTAGRLVARVLDLGPLVWLGRLSYSLYLWQQLFVVRPGQHWLQAFPLNIVAALAMATLSYYLIEQPILRRREGWRSWTRRRAVAQSPER